MKARVVVITGCSSGFGLEMTQQFLENGDRVIATMREALSEKSSYLVLTKGLQKMMANLSSRPKAPGASKVATIVLKLSQKKRIPRAVTVGGDAFFVKILQALLPFDTYQRLTRKIYLRFLTKLGHE